LIPTGSATADEKGDPMGFFKKKKPIVSIDQYYKIYNEYYAN